MDYLDFYELSQEPFSNAPVSRFYYDSAQHSQALLRLKYALTSMKGLAVLVGGIGAGKTTLARRLLDALDEKEFEAALLVIIHSDITSDWLLRRIAVQLGVEDPATEKLVLLSQLYRRLIEIYESGKKAVVLIDEAQMLAKRELMEEFRGLLNLEVPERKLLSFVFFGLPEIEDNLRIDLPLAQRVALRVRLDPFDLAATDAYVRHRLRVAGARRPIFDSEAIRAVHVATGGTPRLINTVCDNALFEGALGRTTVIGLDLVRSVARNLSLPTDEPVTSADYLNPAFPQSQLPTIIPGAPVAPPPPQLHAASPTALALDEIDRVLAALGKLG
ncbi:AAA family ATPase [Myxococcota bacterium]|nr:AAA family ATPase [Myxococcota bacterium]